jgi:hypothetical protein
VDLVIDNMSGLLKVDRVYDFIRAVVLVAVLILRLTTVA